LKNTPQNEDIEMAHASKKQRPSNPWTLCEAVYWIVTGDPTPDSVKHLIDNSFDQAAHTLYRALRGGVLKAYGRVSPRSQPRFSQGESLQILPEHWRPDKMQWWNDELETPEFVYTNITISKGTLVKNVDHLRAHWPEKEHGEARKRKAGRQREYDREAFWRLAFWHSLDHGAPKNQYQFAEEIALILDLAWEDLPERPADTWLKERASELFASRSIYERVIKRLNQK
jgi:hypothetical protein